MVKVIENESELIIEMQKIVETVINDVTWDLSTILEYYIKEYTYRFEYFPNVVYHNKKQQPTYEFLRAWRWKKLEKKVKELFIEMYYDKSLLKSQDNKTWLHGSPLWGDSREFLADILNTTGYTSSLSLNGKRPLSKFRMPYWDLYIEFLFSKNEITRRFDKEFRKYGITRI